MDKLENEKTLIRQNVALTILGLDARHVVMHLEKTNIIDAKNLFGRTWREAMNDQTING